MRIFIEHHALITTCVVVVEKGLLFFVEEEDLVSRLSDPTVTLRCLWLNSGGIISYLPPFVDLLDVVVCYHTHEPLVSKGLFELTLKLDNIIIHSAYPCLLSQLLTFLIDHSLLSCKVFAAPFQERDFLLYFPAMLLTLQDQLLI